MDSNLVIQANLFALLSALCFSSASLLFGIYAKRISVLWMTAFKATVALFSFGVLFLFVKDWGHAPSLTSLLAFFVSGLLGLNIADLFLVRAFSSIGSARTLMIFSFQPIVLGLLGFFFFEQVIVPMKGLAILFMIACVFILSYEKFREHRRWDFAGPLFAIIGMLFDAVGIVLTRFAFNTDTLISPLEGNFYRCMGACAGFFMMSYVKPFHLRERFLKANRKSKVGILLASLVGTTLSLSLYLVAVAHGHLATISAIVGSAPIFAATWECLYERQAPSKFLLLAFVMFGAGFLLLLT